MTAPAPREADRYAYCDYRRWAAALRTDAAAAQSLAETLVRDDERHGPLSRTVQHRKAALYEAMAQDFRDAAEQYDVIADDLRAHLVGER